MSCLINGCDKKHEAHGLCKSHYNKAVRNGEILTIKGRGRPRIYTDEERKERARIKSKEKYRRKILNNPKPKREVKKGITSWTLFRNARSRSKKLNLPFDITHSDIVIPEICPLLNIPLFSSIGFPTDNSPTLDRIIPALGYIKGNIQVISMRANRIKDNATFEEFQTIYKNWLNQR